MSAAFFLHSVSMYTFSLALPLFLPLAACWIKLSLLLIAIYMRDYWDIVFDVCEWVCYFLPISPAL